MLATRSDEVRARRCACQAMSGLGITYEPLSFNQPSPLSPPPYEPLSTEIPHDLKTGANTVLKAPEPEPIPVKQPFDWSKFGSNMTNLLSTYSAVDAAKRQTEITEREAARQQQIAQTAKMAAEAKARAAAAQQGIQPPKQGMSTGTKVAIGVGVAAAAAAAYAALS